jgi:flagellar hook-associated protein 2
VGTVSDTISSNSLATGLGTISFDGLATGINTTDVVDKLIEVESRPKTLKEAEKTRLDNQLATWQEINTRLLDVRTKAQTLWKASTWNTLSPSSSDTSILTATASSAAQAGTYTLEVDSLARSHQMASQSFGSAVSAVGTGSLTLEVNSKSTMITVDSTNNTLTGLAAAINQADAGVTASVIRDGSGYRLLMVSDEGGTENSINLVEGGTVSLGATTVQSAQNALVKLGSGSDAISISSSSNVVTDVIPGVTLNLVSASPGSSVTLTMTRDTTAVEENIDSFVQSYNAAVAYIGQQFAFDSQTNTGGILMGDRTLLAIQTRLQALLSSPVQTGGKYQSLRGLGVEWNDDGTLAFDPDRFAAAVSDDYPSVAAMFQTSGRTEHSKVSFVYAGPDAAEPSVAGYAVVITRAAEQASLSAQADVSSLTIDDSNDTISLSLDGGSTLTVQLAHDIYGSYADLAAEVQAKINAAASGGAQVTVEAVGGRLGITSYSYGSASKISLSGGNGLSNLGFSAGDEDVGVDVAGTIDGKSATGVGQSLTGDKGNKAVAGVWLQVQLTPQDLLDAGGSVTTSLHFSKGVGARLNEYLMGLTMPAVGAIGMRETAISESIQTTQDQIDEMTTRLAARRDSLLQQFQHMEEAVSSLNTQGNYLANMLGGLSKNWQWNA